MYVKNFVTQLVGISSCVHDIKVRILSPLAITELLKNK